MLINTFSMQHNIIKYTGITQCNQFYKWKTEFFKIIDKPGILWLYHWYSVLILVFNFH
jgi:GTP-binding protein EngB required for normal cell division